jgi:hypothetical protein
MLEPMLSLFSRASEAHSQSSFYPVGGNATAKLPHRPEHLRWFSREDVCSQQPYPSGVGPPLLTQAGRRPRRYHKSYNGGWLARWMGLEGLRPSIVTASIRRSELDTGSRSKTGRIRRLIGSWRRSRDGAPNANGPGAGDTGAYVRLPRHWGE